MTESPPRSPAAEGLPSSYYVKPASPRPVIAVTVLCHEGLWHDVVLTILGDEVINKEVGKGDLMQMAVERGIARLVGEIERQKNG